MRLHAPDADAGDVAAFRAWLAADPRHAEEYRAIAAIWDASAHLEPQALPVVQPLRRRSLAPMLARAAAVFAVAAAIGWAAGLVPGRAAVHLAAAEVRAVTLPDGSHVDLNTGTALVYGGFRDRRAVYLPAGEAFFAVAPDAAAPFTVHTPDGAVTVTGTRFNVWSDAGRLVVTLDEGEVLVAVPGGSSVRLTPGRQAVVEPGATAAVVADADAAVASAWREGKLILDDLSLAEAVPLFNRYLDTPLRIDDPRVAALRIGGLYETRSLHTVPQQLTRILPLVAVPEDGALVLRRRHPPS